MSARKPPRAKVRVGWLRASVIAGLIASGCAANQVNSQAPASSIQAVQYYPFQVKGYEGTYPKRRVIVIAALDARDFKDIGTVAHAPSGINPAIGVAMDQNKQASELLYGPPLGELVQNAIVQAANEAGMTAVASPLALHDALAARDADYVIGAKITRCWVAKRSGIDRPGGALSSAVANVALAVSVYKPPFDVPFWDGEAAATYDDPPAPVSGSSLDEAEIYDQPGEVLSVALTRAVAGIFQHEELHLLIRQDQIGTH